MMSWAATWLYWAALDWTVVDCTGLYWAAQGFPGLQWAVLGCNGLY